MVTQLAQALDGFVVRVGRVAAWAGLLLVLVTMADVTMRTATQSSWDFLRDLSAAQQRLFGSTALQELEWHLHTVLFLLCLGYAYIKGAHVRIDLVRERLSQRAKAVIEIVGVLLFLLPFCGLVIVYGIEFTAASFEQGEGSASGGGLAHRWIIKAALPIGMALLALSGVATLLRNLSTLSAPRQP